MACTYEKRFYEPQECSACVYPSAFRLGDIHEAERNMAKVQIQRSSMRISHRYSFVFLSNPRSASRSVREVLDEYSDIKSVHSSTASKRSPIYHHMPAREAKQVFDEKEWDWFAYHRFCTVRNPYARMVSLYHHYLEMRTRITTPDMAPTTKIKAFVKYKILPRYSFSGYVLRPDKIRKIAMPLDQFIFDQDGTCLVDDIIMYETLAQDLPRYLQGIGIDLDPRRIPRIGTSSIRSYKAFYDETTRSFVRDLYQYEIDRFGYSMDDLD